MYNIYKPSDVDKVERELKINESSYITIEVTDFDVEFDGYAMVLPCTIYVLDRKGVAFEYDAYITETALNYYHNGEK